MAIKGLILISNSELGSNMQVGYPIHVALTSAWSTRFRAISIACGIATPTHLFDAPKIIARLLAEIGHSYTRLYKCSNPILL